MEYCPVHMRWAFALPCGALARDEVCGDEGEEGDECEDSRNLLAIGLLWGLGDIAYLA